MYAKLKKPKDFAVLAKVGQSFFCKEFGIKIIKNNFNYNRYGIVVNLKVDKRAVMRNKIRRRISEILRLNNKNIRQGHDIMVLTSESTKNLSFSDIEIGLLKLFKKAKLVISNK